MEPDTTAAGDLVRRARAGDRSAWDELVEEFSPMIWNVVRSYRLSHADASDAHAMTWIRLLDNIGRIREPDRVAGWLRRTASNEAISIIRKQSRFVAVDANHLDAAPDPQSTADAQVLVDEDVQLVRRAIQRLGDTCQQLLRLLYAEPQLSYAEVAEVMGRPIGFIGPTRQRCLEKLRASLLQEDSQEDPQEAGRSRR